MGGSELFAYINNEVLKRAVIFPANTIYLPSITLCWTLSVTGHQFSETFFYLFIGNFSAIYYMHIKFVDVSWLYKFVPDLNLQRIPVHTCLAEERTG